MKLQQKGFHNLSFAGNGQQALEEIAKAPFVFDLILMDVMMPIMVSHFNFTATFISAV